MSDPSFIMLADGQVQIEQFGGPRTRISAELLDLIVRGELGPAVTWTAPPCPDNPDSPNPEMVTHDHMTVPAHVIGGILRIDGVNGRLVYRITGYEVAVDYYTAEWPD